LLPLPPLPLLPVVCSDVAMHGVWCVLVVATAAVVVCG
jgi:hypothetical protein